MIVTKHDPQIISTLVLSCLMLLFLSSVVIGDATRTDNSEVLDIQLAGVRDQEAEVAEQLLALTRKFDLRPWLFTRQIRIKADVIPQSHPVLTLHTRHLHDPEQLLATFVHEQIHWFTSNPNNAASIDCALAVLREIYPQVPDARNGGASSEESTYRHLIVNWLELDALISLLDQEQALTVFKEKTYYQWIYARVAEDRSQLESIIREHGLSIDHDIR